MNFSDVIGIIGVISCLVAYAGLQLGRFHQDDLRYLGLNPRTGKQDLTQ
jgi:hypothetical protein